MGNRGSPTSSGKPISVPLVAFSAMENPFRSEEAAYRFLMVTVGAIALIVAAKVVIGTWAAPRRVPGRAGSARRLLRTPAREAAGAGYSASSGRGGREAHPRRRQRDRRRRGASRRDRAVAARAPHGGARRLPGAELAPPDGLPTRMSRAGRRRATRQEPRAAPGARGGRGRERRRGRAAPVRSTTRCARSTRTRS